MADRNIPGGDASFASVALLAHFDGANGATSFTEQTGKTLTAAGDAKLSTTSPKFGSASLALDGSGDWVSTPGVSDFVFGAGDFTVEAWIKTSTTREQLIVDFYVPLQLSWQLELSALGKLNFYGSNGATNGSIASGVSVLTNGVWRHVAVSRASGTLRLFVDGALEATVADSRNYSYTTATLAIGAQVATRNASYDFPGNIDDVRITKGVARYTAAFTPSGLPFPDSSGAALDQILDGVLQSAAMAAPGSASAVQTLSTVGQSATAAAALKASAAQTLSAVSQVAASSVVATVTGAQGLAGVGQAASVVAGAPSKQISAAQTLASVSQSTAAAHAAAGAAAQVLNAVAQAATARVLAQAAGSQTLASVAQMALLAAIDAATAAQHLDDVTQVATLRASIMGSVTAAQVLEGVVQLARVSHSYGFERNERTLLVAGERRAYAVIPELRSVAAVPELRTAAIAGERRRIAVTD